MTIGKKLDRIFKKYLPKEFIQDKEVYQSFFAQVAKVATDESDIFPWIPVKKQLPDHKEAVMVWIERHVEDPEVKSSWHVGWYDWQHEDWIAAGIPISETKGRWEVTHWTKFVKP